MGQVIIRKLEDDVIALAKRKASADGKSLEQFLRELITDAVKPSKTAVFAKVDALLGETGYSLSRPPEDLVREDRDAR